MQFQSPFQLSKDSFQADSVIENHITRLSIDSCLKLADTDTRGLLNIIILHVNLFRVQRNVIDVII